MPAKRRQLDPLTGDYTVTKGGPVEDGTNTSTVVLLLRLRRGSCPVAPELGNAIYTMQKLGDGAERTAERYAHQALEPLTRSRRIRDLSVVAEVDGAGRLVLGVEFVDQDGNQRALSLPVARGA